MNVRRTLLDGDDPIDLSPGEYAKWDGRYYAMTPNGLLANLGNHTITEHEDGTITVAPSILCKQSEDRVYHGFLVRGVWSDA